MWCIACGSSRTVKGLKKGRSRTLSENWPLSSTGEWKPISVRLSMPPQCLFTFSFYSDSPRQQHWGCIQGSHPRWCSSERGPQCPQVVCIGWGSLPGPTGDPSKAPTQPYPHTPFVFQAAPSQVEAASEYMCTGLHREAVGMVLSPVPWPSLQEKWKYKKKQKEKEKARTWQMPRFWLEDHSQAFLHSWKLQCNCLFRKKIFQIIKEKKRKNLKEKSKDPRILKKRHRRSTTEHEVGSIPEPRGAEGDFLKADWK